MGHADCSAASQRGHGYHLIAGTNDALKRVIKRKPLARGTYIAAFSILFSLMENALSAASPGSVSPQK